MLYLSSSTFFQLPYLAVVIKRGGRAANDFRNSGLAHAQIQIFLNLIPLFIQFQFFLILVVTYRIGLTHYGWQSYQSSNSPFFELPAASVAGGGTSSSAMLIVAFREKE